MAKIYPIGVQSFAKLREDGYTYVDKTQFVDNLIQSGKYYLLIRPRRFGKSLLLSTIEAFYQGRRDLFEGLAISRQEHDWQQHPVLHIALNAWDYDSPESLLQKFNYDFERWENLYGTERQSAPHSERFRYIMNKPMPLRAGK